MDIVNVIFLIAYVDLAYSMMADGTGEDSTIKEQKSCRGILKRVLDILVRIVVIIRICPVLACSGVPSAFPDRAWYAAPEVVIGANLVTCPA